MGLFKDLIMAVTAGYTAGLASQQNKDVDKELVEAKKKEILAEQAYKEADADFYESLKDYPGETMEEKEKAFEEDLSKIKFDSPIRIKL